MSNGGSYEPKAIEADIYRFWEEGGYFHAVPSADRRPFVVDIPLPNVTGALHLGHALNNTLQDVLIRHARMRGFEALWMPGTDHAGIATQAVVERELKKKQNLTRHELGRDGLVQKIWEWKEEYGGRILNQLRQMGFSCDWARTRFTLDEVCAKAVYEAFFQWFKAGLIYRGTRLVNWDAFLQTAVADDEVIHETVKSNLWHVKYPIERDRGIEGAATRDQGSEGASTRDQGIEGSRDQGEGKEGRDYLVVATTRPETMLGDTAVAVHPDDRRYKHLIGRHVLLPLMNRRIPIIPDPILVNPEFGTGCVKVTPAHDPNDYLFSQRHPEAAPINILTKDGKINENGGAYAGMDRYDARKKVVEDLEKLGLLVKIEPYETQVGHSDRSKTPIEPMISEQWFLKMGELAESAMEAVRDGRVRFFPQRYEQMYLDWLGEKRDWCISRQLWWGHRIPVWTYKFAIRDFADYDIVFLSGGLEHLIRGDHGYRIDPSNFVFRITSADGRQQPLTLFLEPPPKGPQGEFIAQVCYIGSDPQVIQGLEQAGFVRDEDVLDTWFSSSLWPFSTLGWPHEDSQAARSDAAAQTFVPSSLRPSVPTRADYAFFYPTSTLVTGRGIITLWVARMVMTGLYFTQRVPFQHVHIHPIIQDGQGRTMSKSLGNGVDPLDIIELYGTDALRFVMAQMDTETQDVRMPVKPVKLPVGGADVPAGQTRTVNSSEKFEIGRNFCNKIWQAATGVVISNLAGHTSRPLTPADLELEDHWILSRLAATIGDVDRRMARYQISEVANILYSFFWSDFCDWYLELSKPRLFGRNEAGEMVQRSDGSADAARQVLAWVLDQSLRLMHPIMPFITEALWARLNAAAPRRGITQLVTGEPALIKAAWPEAAAWTREPAIEAEMEALQNVIRGLRDTLAWINTVRAAGKTPAIGKLPQAVIRAVPELAANLAAQRDVMCRLGRCEALEIGPDLAKPAESATRVFPGVEIYVPIAGLIDLTLERQRLAKERGELAEYIHGLAGKLSNDGFVSKAPPAVVQRERERLAELQEKLAAIERNLAELGA